MNDPQLTEMLSGRDFTTEDDPLPVDLENEVVLDVIILARVIRKEDIGTGNSGIVIINENQTDDLMVTGILTRAYQIDMNSTYIHLDGED